jgi:hypothetical protein
MYQIKSINNAGQVIIHGEMAELADAINAIRGKIYSIEEDLPDHPNHFDLITWQGDIFSIEPKKEPKQ